MSMTIEELKQIRKDSGLTQTDFAKRIGVTKCSVAFWECGMRKMANHTETLIRLVFNRPAEKKYFVEDLTPDLFPDDSPDDGGDKAP